MNPLALFAGPMGALYKWGVIALLIAAFGAFSWFKGNEHGTQKLIDYQAKQATEAVKVIVKQGEATVRVIDHYIQVKGATKVVTETVEKEVIKYVESKPLAMACMLDNRWIGLHDSAATGTVPGPAAPTDGASGGIDAAQALPGITGNYAKANRNKDRYEGLKAWVREQYKATNGKDLGY